MKEKKKIAGFVYCFNLFMIRDLLLVGPLEMPYVPRYQGPMPVGVAPFNKTKNSALAFWHFYLRDGFFDGKDGVWNGCSENFARHQRIYRRLLQAPGTISPDFSVYVDLPLIQQLWNIYRGRVTCLYWRSLGIPVIFNIRWGDYRTYDAAFSYIEKGSVVAVGNHGQRRSTEDRKIFLEGFLVMLDRVSPSDIVFYGSTTEQMLEACEAKGVRLHIFEDKWGAK